MQSNNPVFRNSDEFNGSANAYGNQVYDGSGTAHQGLRHHRPVHVEHRYARRTPEPTPAG